MRPHTNLAAVSLALTVAFTSAALAADTYKPFPGQPNGDVLLQRMSSKLAGARQFTFEATREMDPALLPGRNLPEKAHVVVKVQRPNKLAARGESKMGARRFIFDGRTLTLLDERMNDYATVPMHTTINGLVDRLDAQYGFVPPLADFAVSNAYAEIHRQANTVTYGGQDKLGAGFLGLGGVWCDVLLLKGREADAKLWIVSGEYLPKKLVATFHRPGQPQLRIDFSRWNLAATVTATDFAFTPPKGAVKIEMWTTGRMAAAGRKSAARKN